MIINKSIVLGFLFFMTSNVIVAQFEINYFYIYQLNETVKLSWEVKSGSTCSGMQIERSTDSINYVFIGEIQGICGSTSASQQMEFTDENPIAFKKNYYRIVAGSGEMFYQSHFFNFVRDAYFLISNPVSESTTVYFKGNESFIVTFYDLIGKIIHSTQTTQSIIQLKDLIPAIPSTPFLLDVKAKNGTHDTKKLIGIR